MKSKPIDVVQNISALDFRKKYLFPQKPVVVKGLVEPTPAASKWTIDYIREVCGDVMVDVYDNANPNKATAFTNPDLKMKFSDYVSSITAPQGSTLRMFLFNMFKVKPELRKDFPCPPLMRGIMGRVGFMFFGAKDIKVRIHQDMDFSNVMLTQFYGRKKVVLVAPEYSRLLYKLPFNTHSLVDLDEQDLDKYPGLKYVQTLDCVLEPGDSLFMPSGYWHYITYLDGGFSVSYRKMANNPQSLLQGFLSLCIYLPFDKLMHFFLKEKWLSLKEKLAERRANREIRQISKRRQRREEDPRLTQEGRFAFEK